jgi:hypothetical protein
MKFTDPLPPASPAGEDAGQRQRVALETAYGESAAELDEAWRKFVLRKYPK